MTDAIVVFVTAASDEEALRISENLLQNKLIACANISPGLTSIFRWQDKICRESEMLLILKTQKQKYPAVESKIKELHSYDVPEIIALPIVDGSSEYLNWVIKETLE